MKIYAQKFIYPEVGTKRIKKEFLFFPFKLDGITRWLENAEWEEEYCDVSSYWDRVNGWRAKHWIDIDIAAYTKTTEWK